jgi:agmatinase
MNVLTSKSNFLGIPAEFSSFENSQIVILPVPFERTVSYGKGTKNGPEEIIKASRYVEFYDEELRNELCFEKGIATLPELNLDTYPVSKGINLIYKKVKKLLDQNKFVVTLGGEHSLSLAPIKAHHEKFNNISILQIDAHSDLRNSYEGSKYSHASVMARVTEFNKDIVQVGIRAQCKEEVEFIRKNNLHTFYMRDIRLNKFGKQWQNRIADCLNDNVYITFDVDGLDPAIIPATGTPEPGGLFWDETMNLLRLVGKQKNIVGFDLVELAPSEFQSASNFIAAKLVYKLMNYAFFPD